MVLNQRYFTIGGAAVECNRYRN